MRKRIEAKAPGELASRRAELEPRRLADVELSSVKERLTAVEQRIASGNEHLAEIAKERAGMIVQSPSNGERLVHLDASERRAVKQIGQLEAERDGFAVEMNEASRPTSLSSTERAELVVIEDRLAHFARRQASVARRQTPKMIEETLGARPKDRREAALWNEGVHAIYSYRLRYGINSTSGHPLGPKSREDVRSRDRNQAEIRLRRVLQKLGREQARRAERGMHIGH